MISIYILFFFNYVLNRLLIFEALLASHVIAGLFGYFDWYNEVDDGLYLGRHPYPNMFSVKKYEN